MMHYKQLVAGLAVLSTVMGTTVESHAQRRPNPHFLPYSSVTFGVGTSTYFGDLAGYRTPLKTLFTLPRWNAGIGYTRQFTPNFAARAMFTWARITGDDYTFSKGNPGKFAAQYVRNLHFRNDLKEFAVTGIYNFIADGRTSKERAQFTPYIFGGLALVAHDPEARIPTAESAPGDATVAQSPRAWAKLQPLKTEGQGQPGYAKPYSLVTLAIPVGIGARYRLNEMFNVGVEIGFRYTFTDYLDDAGSNYANPDALQGLAKTLGDRRLEVDAARINKPRGEQLNAFQQSNPELFTTPIRGAHGLFNDGYLLTNFSIQYIIPTQIKCPPIK